MICGGLFKTLLCVSSFVLFFVGALLIGAGIYQFKEVPMYLAFFDGHFANGAIILCVFGAILFVLGFLGCCGASKENNCLLYTFAVLLAAIVLTEVGAEFTKPQSVQGLCELTNNKT